MDTWPHIPEAKKVDMYSWTGDQLVNHVIGTDMHFK